MAPGKVNPRLAVARHSARQYRVDLRGILKPSFTVEFFGDRKTYIAGTHLRVG
jgi:hypothetical protein